ncbi:MAG: ABC transporter ATP-binding protein [Dehalococcoidales bacterium]
MAYLDVKNLEVYYGKARALSDVSFSIEEGKCVGIIGSNGAGKTTLLDSIFGMTSWSGDIVFDGESLHKLPSREIVKRKIGYSPERGSIFPGMSVRDNLLVGAYLNRENIEKNMKTVFELFPRLEERQKQQADTMSGGERQMLSLGRAFMTEPRLILLDEPTLGLAPIVIGHISEAIRSMKRTGFTILIAEQNASFTIEHAENIYILERGAITHSGTAQELGQEEYIRDAYFGE